VIGIDKWQARRSLCLASHHDVLGTPKQSEVVAPAGEIGKVFLDTAQPRSRPEAAKLADSAAGAAPDSPIAATATYTIDSDISPLLPKHSRLIQEDAQIRASGKEVPGTSVVTILRGSGKASESKASEPVPKGS
jgi:hypothetical protein